MKLAAIILGCVCVGALLLVLVLGLNYDPNSSPEVQASQEKLQATYSVMMAEDTRKLIEAEYDLIAARDGKGTADFWIRCTTSPPSHPENQKACAATIARMKREDADAQAREDKRKASW